MWSHGGQWSGGVVKLCCCDRVVFILWHTCSIVFTHPHSHTLTPFISPHSHPFTLSLYHTLTENTHSTNHTLTPSLSHLHTLTPSHPHPFTPSPLHTLTPSHPHPFTVTPSHPHPFTPSHPHSKKQEDARQLRHISQLKKETRKKENKIQSLEADAQRKAIIMKRRADEVIITSSNNYAYIQCI